ncbi:hypothetical protein [Rhizobium sp. BK068]|uniref:hypothetical protein n=1 Tax=Rhizobium sp. BK068 TaxID=2512130 RepID=UPI001051767A|nr:hypothetical protein [Rhizobium sp. BK068]TCM72114.1 hypothetical protein EV291_12189 [Rhizobium sp. BK068]
MFFLGGMTMGYLQPSAKIDREAAPSTSIPGEKGRRLLETPEATVRCRQGAGDDRSLLWAWRILV